MTREQWKERLPLIQAFADGKNVQALRISYWVDLGDSANFNNPIEEYRIKPDPRFVPWTRKTAPEMILLWGKFTRVPDVYWLGENRDGYVITSGKVISFKELADGDFYWSDSLTGERKRCGTWENV